MIECAVQEFLSQLQSNYNSQVTVLFYRKVDGIIQQMADASYTLYIVSAGIQDSSLQLRLTNGMENAGRSEMNIIIPNTAVYIKQSETEWQVEYPLDNKVQVIKVLFTPKVFAKPSQVVVGKPAIKEFRNNNGELARLYIESPEEGANIEYLNKIKSVLDQLLSSWITITVTGSDLVDFAGEVVTYSGIELIMLPGNTFYELQLETAKGERTLEIATTLSVDLEKSKISFSLEGDTFEIKKSA